jgi:hypothetical protein
MPLAVFVFRCHSYKDLAILFASQLVPLEQNVLDIIIHLLSGGNCVSIFAAAA